MGKMDFAAIRDVYLKEKEERANRGKAYYAKPGQNVIRILPPWGFPWKEGGVHYGLGPKGDQTLLCPAACAGEPCPVCEAVAEMYATGEAADRQLASDLRVKRKFFINVIVRGQEDMGVRVFECGPMVYNGITQILHTYYEDEGIDITDPEAGRDLVVIKTGKGKSGTRYSVQARARDSKLSDDPAQAKEWLDETIDLDEYVAKRVPSYEKIKAIFRGEDPPSEAAPAPPPAPAKPKKKKKKKKKKGKKTAGATVSDRLKERMKDNASE